MSDKREAFEALWSEEGLVRVEFDPRVDGVVLPNRQWVRRCSRATIVFGNARVVDTLVTNESISAYSVTERARFVVPWGAVFGVFNRQRRGYVYKESMPPEAAFRWNGRGFVGLTC